MLTTNETLEPATLLNVKLLHGCFSRFLYKWYQNAQHIISQSNVDWFDHSGVFIVDLKHLTLALKSSHFTEGRSGSVLSLSKF